MAQSCRDSGIHFKVCCRTSSRALRRTSTRASWASELLIATGPGRRRIWQLVVSLSKQSRRQAIFTTSTWELIRTVLNSSLADTTGRRIPMAKHILIPLDQEDDTISPKGSLITIGGLQGTNLSVPS